MIGADKMQTYHLYKLKWAKKVLCNDTIQK